MKISDTEPPKVFYHWEKRKYGKICGLKFQTKTSMPNPVKNLEHIKCYSLSSPRSVKSPSNSIGYSYQKIGSWLNRPKTTLEIRKKTTFLLVIKKPITYKFFRDFTNYRKKTNRVVLFCCRPFPKTMGRRYELIRFYSWVFYFKNCITTTQFFLQKVLSFLVVNNWKFKKITFLHKNWC